MCVPPVDGWSAVSPAQLLSSLLCWAVPQRCASAQQVLPPLRRHVKPPSSLKSKRGQTHPPIHCPSTPPPNPPSCPRGCQSKRGQGEGQIREVYPFADALSLAGKVERKFQRLLLLRSALLFQRSAAGKANCSLAVSFVLHAWNIKINMMNLLNWLSLGVMLKNDTCKSECHLHNNCPDTETLFLKRQSKGDVSVKMFYDQN